MIIFIVEINPLAALQTIQFVKAIICDHFYFQLLQIVFEMIWFCVSILKITRK